jgi:hypothetical protein
LSMKTKANMNLEKKNKNKTLAATIWTRHF